MKPTYYKYPSNCLYISFNSKLKISVDLYDFHTGITLRDYVPTEQLERDNYMIECSKLEFDKAFNLALALISNKSLNT